MASIHDAALMGDCGEIRDALARGESPNELQARPSRPFMRAGGLPFHLLSLLCRCAAAARTGRAGG